MPTCPRFEREKQEEKKLSYSNRPVHGAKPQQGHQMAWRKIPDGRNDGEENQSKKRLENEDRKYEEGRKGGEKGEKSMAKWKGSSGRNGRQHREPPKQMVLYYRKKNLCDVWYNASEEELNKFKKMYVAKVRYAGSAHMVQEWFNLQGFFSIKVTPLGANLVLLEEVEEGIIPALVSDAKEWIDEHFDDIRGWCPSELDKERVVSIGAR